jgi:hypothetical protein
MIVIGPGDGSCLALQDYNKNYNQTLVLGTRADLYWHYVDESADASRYLGSIPLGQEVVVPLSTEVDRAITIRAITRTAYGPADSTDIRFGEQTEGTSTRIDATPVIYVARPATFKHIVLGIDNWSRFARVRKVESAFTEEALDDQDVDAGYVLQVFDLDLGWDGDDNSIESNTLPDFVTLTREYTDPTDFPSPLFGENTRFIRIAHSFESTARATGATYLDKVNALLYTEWSNVEEVDYADDAVTNEGGSTPASEYSIGIPDAWPIEEHDGDGFIAARAAELVTATDYIPGVMSAGPTLQYLGGKKFFRQQQVWGAWDEAAGDKWRPPLSNPDDNWPTGPAAMAFNAPLAAYGLGDGINAVPGRLHFYNAYADIESVPTAVTPLPIVADDVLGRIAPAAWVGASGFRFSGRIDFVAEDDPDVTNLPVSVDIYGGLAHQATDNTGTRGLRIDSVGNAVLGVGNPLGTAVAGFAWVPKFQAAPTGDPVPDHTGYSPIGVYNGSLYVYDGADWNPAGSGGGSSDGSGTELQRTDGAGGFVKVTSSSVSGGAITLASILTLSVTDTNTSGTAARVLADTLTISPAGSSTATYYAHHQTIAFGTAQNLTGSVVAKYTTATHSQSATLSNYWASYDVFTKDTAGAATSIIGHDWLATTAVGTTDYSGGYRSLIACSGGTITASEGAYSKHSVTGGTMTSGIGFFAEASRTSGTFTTFTAFAALATGTIGTKYGFISSSGFLHGFGTITPTVTVDVVGNSRVTLTTSESFTVRSLVQTNAYWDTAVDSATGSNFQFIKSRGTAFTSRAAVSNGDTIGMIGWNGYVDATTQWTVASIQVEAQDNFASFNWPVDMTFLTASDFTRRVGMRITSGQRVGVGDQISHSDVTHQLTVIGNVKLNLGSDATGDIWYRAATTGTFTRLGIGSTGDVLTVAAGLPSWAAPSAGSPAGSGTELQYKNGSSFGAVTSSSVSGAAVTLGGKLAVSYTNTATSSTQLQLDQTFTISPASSSSATYYVHAETIAFGTAQTLSGTVVARYSTATHSQNSSLANYYGTYDVFTKDTANSATSVIGNEWAATLSTGTTSYAGGFRSSLIVSGATVSDSVGFRAYASRSSGTLTQFIAFLAEKSGTIGTAYGFVAGSGFLNGFGLTPTYTLDVSGTVRFALGSDATGDIWYRDSSGLMTRLGVGTNGHVLTLASGLPSWAAAAGGGANTALSNLASVSINASLLPQTTLDLGSTTKPWRDLYLYGSGTFGTHYFKLTGTPTSTRTLTLPDTTATVTVGTGSTNALSYWSDANTVAAVSGSSVSGAAITLGGKLTVTYTNTATSSSQQQIAQTFDIGPAGSSSANYYIQSQTISFGTAQTLSGSVVARYTTATHSQNSSLANYYGGYSSFVKDTANSASSVIGYEVFDTLSSGTTAYAAGFRSSIICSGATVTSGYGYYAYGSRSSGTFTTYVAFGADKNGTIGTAYGFISVSGFLHGFGVASPTAVVEIAAGTSSVAPLKLTSGTNLSSAVAGAVEYDGKVFYASHVASARGVVPTQMFAIVASGSDFTLSASSSAQAYFTGANDALTVVANTTYFFETIIYLTTGSTTHTTGFLFGGTATFTDALVLVEGTAVAVDAASSTYGHMYSKTVTAAIIPTATSGTQSYILRVRGMIRTANAGTLIPQIKFSANPTGTNLSKAGTYFRCWPAGTDTVASVGNWG